MYFHFVFYQNNPLSHYLLGSMYSAQVWRIQVIIFRMRKICYDFLFNYVSNFEPGRKFITWGEKMSYQTQKGYLWFTKP